MTFFPVQEEEKIENSGKINGLCNEFSVKSQ